MADERTPAQIREEIRAERAKLDAAVTAFTADAKRSGRLAGTAAAGLGSLWLLAKLLSRRG